MTKNCKLTVAYIAVAVLLFACSQPQATAELVAEILPLPEQLREISGLAHIGDGQLIAIADELGTIFRINFNQKDVAELASFGQPPTAADFEGLAVRDGSIYAITSSGVLYQRSIADIDPASFRKVKTKLGKQCEIEGLAADPNSPLLWLLCKTPYKKKHKNKLVVFAWNVVEQRQDKTRTIATKYKALGFKKSLSPSALSISTSGDEMFILAAQQKAFVVISSKGEFVRNGRLPSKKIHLQTEGLAQVGSSMFLADEASKGAATLTRYANGF